MTTRDAARPLLIDRFLPAWDATHVGHAIVDAPPDAVYRAVLEADLGEAVRSSLPVRTVFAMRAAPVRLLQRVRGQRPAADEDAPIRLREVGSWGWVYLGDEEPHEVVVGAIGVFWGPDVRWRPTTAEEFATFDEPGWARIAWNFSVLPYGESRSLLTTECRTQATDPATRRRFLRYWRVVGRFAGMVMDANLPVICRHAEEQARRPTEPAAGATRREGRVPGTDATRAARARS